MLGLRTAIYPVPDLATAKKWYSEVFGVQPYYDTPYYVGFTVGGFELGLMPDATPSLDGVQAYWGVVDAAAELARLVSLGGVLHEAVTEVGEGIKVAAVRDPFGNTLRIIENPLFDRGAVR